MATYAEIYDLKNPGNTTVTTLKKKITVAAAKAALAILGEASSTPNHPARARWANAALVNAEGMAEQMMWAVLGNADVQTNGNDTADADIQWVVETLVNTFAQ